MESRDTRRRFEQWAHNPACAANVVSAILGVKMARVAEKEGLKPKTGQSSLALARGQVFEASLLKKEGLRLRQALEEAGVLPAKSCGFADLRMRRHGGPCADLNDSRERTVELLRRIASGAEAASLAAGATIRVPGRAMLPEAILVLDVLVVLGDAQPRPRLVVGEVKTYPDRGGHTDRRELAGARAQAGTYVHGLREVLVEEKLAVAIDVSDEGFLILTRPGSNWPSVRAGEDLRYQASRAERGLEQLRRLAEELARLPDSEVDHVQAVLGAECSYQEACLGFCDRAPACYRRALAAGSSAILGDAVADFLGSISLDRATAMVRGGKAKTAAERDLLRRLVEGGLR